MTTVSSRLVSACFTIFRILQEATRLPLKCGLPLRCRLKCVVKGDARCQGRDSKEETHFCSYFCSDKLLDEPRETTHGGL